jgi:1,4-dihydroxy-2-naphthoyl-CoA hydrolase
MSIWFRAFTVDEINEFNRGTLAEHLQIRFTEAGPDYLVATMPVDHRTTQTYGMLHGGASVALAETLGSVGANLCVDPTHYRCVGQEINANHLRPIKSGLVTGTTRPVHIGSRSQIWEIRLTDDRQRLTCVSRLTMFAMNVNVSA